MSEQDARALCQQQASDAAATEWWAHTQVVDGAFVFEWTGSLAVDDRQDAACNFAVDG